MLFSIMLLAGCESTLDFQLNAVPKLTIISHLTPDNSTGQQVYVYATQSPSDPSKFYTPDNLVVDITEEESEVTKRLDQKVEDGKVTFVIPSNFLKAGLRYSITAFAPGFEIVKATTL